LPISVLSISKSLVKTLNRKGYVQIGDLLIHYDLKQALSEILNEKELIKMEKITSLIKYSVVSEKFLTTAYPIQKLAFVKPELLNYLQRAGFTTILHLLLPPEIIVKQSSIKEKELMKVYDLLKTPTFLLLELIRYNLNSIYILQNKKIYTLFDLLLSDMNVIAKEIGISKRQLANWLASISKQSLIIAKKELVPIKTSLPFIENNDVVELNKQKYVFLQQLAVLSSVEKKKKVFASENVQKLLKLLEEPISKLVLSDDDVKVCDSLNIKTIKDFILYPASFLDGKLSIKYPQIKRLKSSLKVKKVAPAISARNKVSAKDVKKAVKVTKSQATKRKTSTKKSIKAKKAVSKLKEPTVDKKVTKIKKARSTTKKSTPSTAKSLSKEKTTGKKTSTAKDKARIKTSKQRQKASTSGKSSSKKGEKQ